MKKFIISFVLAVVGAFPTFAQDNIKRPDSYNYQSGVEAYGQENYQQSMDFFDKELQQNPKNGYAMVWKACIYDIYDTYGQALTNINQALKFLPKKDKEWIAMSYGLRAQVQCELGDSVKALNDYNQAFKVYPKADYIYKRCDILHEQKRYAEVDAEIKKALALDENTPVTWVYAGRNEEAKGNHIAAIEKYSYAVKLNPHYSSAYAFRADTYMAMHKYKEACQDVVAALAIDGDNKAFLQIYELADSAMNCLTQQLKAQQLKDPTESTWSYYLGLAKAYVNDYVNAEPAFREALRISESEGQPNFLIYQNLAETLGELGKCSEALEMTDAALAQDSTKTRTWNLRAVIYYDLGKYMPAIENGSKAIELEPDEASLYSSRAAIYMCANMNRNALDDVNTALSLAPDEPQYLLRRGEIYKRMGKTSEANADCNTVVENELAKATDEQNCRSLAYAYARMGNTTKAKPYVEKAFQGRQTKGTEYDKACLYSLIGESDKALAHFEKALQLGFCQFVHIGNDTDLDNIRHTDKFKQLLDEYQKKYSDGVTEAAITDAEYVEETAEVPFTKEAGIYKVKCTINGLPLHFYFDTGAADVTISSVEAQFMLKNDYLKPSDIKGKKYYGTASGDIAEGTVIVLKKVNFGGLELSNVQASVVHNQKAPLLLGQTVLSKLGRIEIDYEKNAIKITKKVKSNSNSKQ